MKVGKLQKLSEELGIQFTRKWGTEGGLGRISILGRGTYFESLYKDLRLTYSEIISEDGECLGSRISLHHSRPLSLGLHCKFNLSLLLSSPDYRDYRDLLAKRVNTPDTALKCWAVEREKGEALFRDSNFTNRLTELLDCLKKNDSALVLNDQRIIVIVPDETLITRDLLEMVYNLSTSIIKSGLVPLTAPPQRLSQKISNTIVISLIVTLIIVSLIIILRTVR